MIWGYWITLPLTQTEFNDEISSSCHQSGCCPAAFYFSWLSVSFNRMFLLLISVIVAGTSVLRNTEFGHVYVCICAVYAAVDVWVL